MSPTLELSAAGFVALVCLLWYVIDVGIDDMGAV